MLFLKQTEIELLETVDFYTVKRQILFTLLRGDSRTQSINNDGLLVTHSRTIFIYAQNGIHDCYLGFV